MTLPPWISITGDVRGQAALRYLPVADGGEDCTCVFCDHVTAVDTWSGCVVRALLEYARRGLGIPVQLSPPAAPAVCAQLAARTGELPQGITISGARWELGEPDEILVPAVRIRERALASQVADFVPFIGAGLGYPRRETRFLGAAFATLVDNAATHAAGSPVDAIAGVAYEPESNELQVVVIDLADGVSGASDSEGALADIWANSTARFGGLAGLAAMAENWGLDVTLSLASGTGRLTWDASGVEHGSDQYVAGFTAAAIVRP
jgi:hypothetical protein